MNWIQVKCHFLLFALSFWSHDVLGARHVNLTHKAVFKVLKNYVSGFQRES